MLLQELSFSSETLSMLKRLRFPIAFKLFALTISLLLAVTFLIALRTSTFFEAEILETHERANQIQAESRGLELEGILQNYADKVRLVASLMYKKYPDAADRTQTLAFSFDTDRELLAIEIFEMKDGAPHSLDRVVKADLPGMAGVTGDPIAYLRAQTPFPLTTIFAGRIELANSSLSGSSGILTLGIPFVKDPDGRVTHVAVADLRLDRIQKAFAAAGASEIFLVDRNGIVLAHPSEQLAFDRSSAATNPVVKSAITSKFRSNHLRDFTLNDRAYYGVFYKTAAGPSVVAQIPKDTIREPVVMAKRQAYYVGGLVLSAALLVISLFSITLTRPIEHLLEITEEVAKGNFDVDATNRIRSRDEVKDLAIAFDRMTTGLKALVRTQGADVAQTLMESDLEHLGGTKKHVTVLFSDLRDFTKFSEGHTPEEVVAMLNEYFEVMVGCVERHQGRVNKFIGDAIMAMWGAPDSTGNDEALALKCALDMRLELAKLNEMRISRGQAPIKIGVGIHVGDVLAGTIGSKSRLEYTVIGDAVNLASRLEASTKAFGVDLLVSQELETHLRDQFLLELAGSAEVKGKAAPLKMFKVNGYVSEEGMQMILKTPYSNFEAESVDKVKVA
jgi:adenylate cyclase